MFWSLTRPTKNNSIKKEKKLKNNDIKWQTNKMPTLICPVSWIIVDIKH